MDGGFVETSKESDLSEIVSGVNSSGDVKSVTVSVVTVSVVLSDVSFCVTTSTITSWVSFLKSSLTTTAGWCVVRPTLWISVAGTTVPLDGTSSRVSLTLVEVAGGGGGGGGTANAVSLSRADKTGTKSFWEVMLGSVRLAEASSETAGEPSGLAGGTGEEGRRPPSDRGGGEVVVTTGI